MVIQVAKLKSKALLVGDHKVRLCSGVNMLAIALQQTPFGFRHSRVDRLMKRRIIAVHVVLVTYKNM